MSLTIQEAKTEAETKFQRQLKKKKQEQQLLMERQARKQYKRKYGHVYGFRRYKRGVTKGFEEQLSQRETEEKKRFKEHLLVWEKREKQRFEDYLKVLGEQEPQKVTVYAAVHPRWRFTPEPTGEPAPTFEAGVRLVGTPYYKPKYETVFPALHPEWRFTKEPGAKPVPTVDVGLRLVGYPYQKPTKPKYVTVYPAVHPTLRFVKEPGAKPVPTFEAGFRLAGYPYYRLEYRKVKRPTDHVQLGKTWGALRKLERMDEALHRSIHGASREEIEAWQPMQRSIRFYEQLGYPEFAGKYAPFKTTGEYKVAGIKETKKGLEITFSVPEEPKGIAETIMAWTLPSLNLAKLLPTTQITGPPLPKKKPLGLIAGQIASVESTLYSVGRLAGLPTPRPPPTLIGGFIGKGVQTVFGFPSVELEQTMEYGAEYAAGTVIGDVFIGLALGKVWEKTAGKLITRKAEAWLTRKYLKKAPLPWKGFREKFVMKVTRAKPYLAPEIVSLPKPPIIKHMETLGLGSYWKYGLTPKTSFLWIEKARRPITKFVPSYFIRGTAMVPLATRLIEAAYKPMPEDFLLSAPKQIGVTVEKPVYGTIPHIPSFTLKPSIHLPSLTGLGLIAFPIPFKKEKRRKKVSLIQKLLTPPARLEPGVITKPLGFEFYKSFMVEKPKKKRREVLVPVLIPRFPLITQLVPKQKKRLRPVKVAKVYPIAEEREKQRLIPTLKLKQPQIQIQIPRILKPPPQPTPQPTPPSYLRQFKYPFRKRKTKLPRGAWFLREHPIKTPKQMLQTLIGKPKKRKTRRRGGVASWV